MNAGILLRDAGEALYRTLDGKVPWDDLPFQQRAHWGLLACPVVLATIGDTKPDGYLALTREIQLMASAWVRAEGGTPPDIPEP